MNAYIIFSLDGVEGRCVAADRLAVAIYQKLDIVPAATGRKLGQSSAIKQWSGMTGSVPGVHAKCARMLCHAGPGTVEFRCSTNVLAQRMSGYCRCPSALSAVGKLQREQLS